MNGGQCGHAEIEFVPLHPHHNATILWQPSLGNIEIRKQLDTRHNGRRQIAVGDLARLLKHSVDAVTQAKAIVKVLQMHIGGFNIQRPLDDLVDSLNYRRLAGEVFQMLYELVVVDIKSAKTFQRFFFLSLTVALER